MQHLVAPRVRPCRRMPVHNAHRSSMAWDCVADALVFIASTKKNHFNRLNFLHQFGNVTFLSQAAMMAQHGKNEGGTEDLHQ